MVDQIPGKGPTDGSPEGNDFYWSMEDERPADLGPATPIVPRSSPSPLTDSGPTHSPGRLELQFEVPRSRTTADNMREFVQRLAQADPEHVRKFLDDVGVEPLLDIIRDVDPPRSRWISPLNWFNRWDFGTQVRALLLKQFEAILTPEEKTSLDDNPGDQTHAARRPTTGSRPSLV